MQRIIVIKKERRAYYLSDDAPEIIINWEALMLCSISSRVMAPDEMLLHEPGGDYLVEERPDLAADFGIG